MVVQEGPLGNSALLKGQQVFLHHAEQGSLLRLPSCVDEAGGLRLNLGRCLHMGDDNVAM